jgi:hypothetical protein
MRRKLRFLLMGLGECAISRRAYRIGQLLTAIVAEDSLSMTRILWVRLRGN